MSRRLRFIRISYVDTVDTERSLESDDLLQRRNSRENVVFQIKQTKSHFYSHQVVGVVHPGPEMLVC